MGAQSDAVFQTAMPVVTLNGASHDNRRRCGVDRAGSQTVCRRLAIHLGLAVDRDAAADGEHAHVARHAFQREIARITARAKHLQAVVDDADRGFAGEYFRLRGEHRVGKRRVLSARARGGVQHQPRGGELGLHVGQHPLQALKFADRPAELRALHDEGEGVFERAGGDAHRHRAGADPLAVIGVH
jgi:hypothetical protein